MNEAVEEIPSNTAPEQLVMVLRRYREALRRALIADDFSPVPPVANWLLIALARRSGTVGELARRLDTTKQAVSRLADQLVGLGYCRRQRGTANRRQVTLSVTEEGRAAAGILVGAIDRLDRELFENVSETDRDAFHRVLATVTAAGAPE
ncbi:MarR family winged helix-turn-helix transcriptional regulator [Sciscionella sediminilitoris]|uniref:MarR family winged helix-turn-helix transcriptional regulator n=1 Tax=Sciscionella sediminilitoris TaxID=1445613 RepID=UPI00068D6F0C|nr:MarR family transcriptional regulator [Sciscionella sp. SE31]